MPVSKIHLFIYSNMRKFLTKIFLLFLLLAIVYATTASIFHYLGHHAKGETARLIYIHDSLTADSLIMGSSRALHHYNPEVLGGQFYNVGEDRMGIIFNYGRFLLLKARHIPKFILYDIEPDYDLLQDDNSTYLAQLRPYYSRRGVSDIFCDVDSTERIKMLFPFYAYNSRLMKILSDMRHPETGYHSGYLPYIGCQAVIREDLPQDKHDTLKYKYLKKLIAVCKHDNIRLVFAASPQLSYQSDSVYHKIKQLSQQEQIPFLNHFCDGKYTQHRKLFHNANHLNSVGADLYTAEIRKELNNLR